MSPDPRITVTLEPVGDMTSVHVDSPWFTGCPDAGLSGGVWTLSAYAMLDDHHGWIVEGRGDSIRAAAQAFETALAGRARTIDAAHPRCPTCGAVMGEAPQGFVGEAG